MRVVFIFLISSFFLQVQAQPGQLAKGEIVNVKSFGIDYEASIVEFANGKYKVHYETSKSDDEWVDGSTVSKKDFGKTAGGPIPGKYVCNFLYATGWAYSGSFVIKNKGTYEYLTGLKGKGNYTYNENTRKIVWQTGDLARKGITGEYQNAAPDGPMISLIFPKGKREGDVQYCICKEPFR